MPGNTGTPGKCPLKRGFWGFISVVTEIEVIPPLLHIRQAPYRINAKDASGRPILAGYRKRGRCSSRREALFPAERKQAAGSPGKLCRAWPPERRCEA